MQRLRHRLQAHGHGVDAAGGDDNVLGAERTAQVQGAQAHLAGEPHGARSARDLHVGQAADLAEGLELIDEMGALLRRVPGGDEMADRIGVINRGEIVLVEEKHTLMRKLGKKQLRLQLQSPLGALPATLASALRGDSAIASAWTARSQLPSTISASGSSISIGWPIHSISPVLPTMNAVGMPFWPAACM